MSKEHMSVLHGRLPKELTIYLATIGSIIAMSFCVLYTMVLSVNACPLYLRTLVPCFNSPL